MPRTRLRRRPVLTAADAAADRRLDHRRAREQRARDRRQVRELTVDAFEELNDLRALAGV